MANNPYLIKLATKISKKKNVPLIILTCEDYVLKKHNYIDNSKLVFKLFQKILVKQTTKALKQSSLNIFNSEFLMKDYIDAFKIVKAIVIMQPSKGHKRICKTVKDTLLYAGNLSNGRFDKIKEFADEIYKFNSLLKIKIFGKFSDELIIKINKIKNASYCGFISQRELAREYDKAEVIFHIESDEPYNLIDLKNSFSSKISNMVMSNSKIFFYSSIEYGFSKYIYNIYPECIAIEKNEIQVKLKKLLNNNIIFNQKRQTLANRHSIENSKVVYSSIRDVIQQSR